MASLTCAHLPFILDYYTSIGGVEPPCSVRAFRSNLVQIDVVKLGDCGSHNRLYVEPQLHLVSAYLERLTESFGECFCVMIEIHGCAVCDSASAVRQARDGRGELVGGRFLPLGRDTRRSVANRGGSVKVQWL